MIVVHEARPSDSHYVEGIAYGRTESDGSTVRPAECRWHMVFVRREGEARALVVGPWSTAGVASWGAGAEILWVKFALGTFMPHLPTRSLLDAETALPDATGRSFWLAGSSWPFPGHEDVETFVERLARGRAGPRSGGGCSVDRADATRIVAPDVAAPFLEGNGVGAGRRAPG